MATKPSAKHPPALCCVSIGGLTTLLLPADAGLQVVKLLRDATLCFPRYSHAGRTYEVESTPDVEYIAVRASQLVNRPSEPPPIRPLAIGCEPLKLPRP